MDHGSGNDNSDLPEGVNTQQDASAGNDAVGVSRRTFSRSSLAGAGVLLTLGNGAAWSQTGGGLFCGKKGTKCKGDKGDKGDKVKVCVSTMILESFQTASHFDHHADDKKFIKYLKYVDINMDPLPGGRW